MPTLQDFRQSYYDLSGSASEVSRKLGFAGIAVIWIFKGEMPDKSFALDPLLYCAAIAIVSSLAFDLLQYIFGAVIWGVFTRIKEKSGLRDDEVLVAPSICNWPALGCFWLKLFLMAFAYFKILWYLAIHIAVK